MRAALALVVSAWLGAAILLAASVAPSAFAVLPSRALAGALVGRVLPALFISGLVLGVLASVVWGARWWPGAALAVSCAIAQFAVGPRIDRVRLAIAGPVEALADTDPRRLAFGRLHALSVGLLGVAMLAALVIVFDSWRSYGQYSR